MTGQSWRVWCLGIAMAMTAAPMEAGTLFYSGNTSTGEYSPGYLDLSDELNPAMHGDSLKITRNVLAPDALHVVFVVGQVSFGRITATTVADVQPLSEPAF